MHSVPTKTPPIFAPTHITDPDIPIATTVLGRLKTSAGRAFNLAIADQSVHHEPGGEFWVYLGLKIAGPENFFPLDWPKVEGKKRPRFNPKNFLPMQAAMVRGKSIVIAAHNPVFTGQLGKGGHGAVYLAQITGQPIVPIAVDTEKTGALHRPTARVIIGSPLHLRHIDGIEQYAYLIEKWESRVTSEEAAILEALEEKKEHSTLTAEESEQTARLESKAFTDEERRMWKKLTAALREQSDILMRAIAALLPEEKRGMYR